MDVWVYKSVSRAAGAHRKRLVANETVVSALASEQVQCSVTFCGKERQSERRRRDLHKNKSRQATRTCRDVERAKGTTKELHKSSPKGELCLSLIARHTPAKPWYRSRRSALKMSHRDIFLTRRPSRVRSPSLKRKSTPQGVLPHLERAKGIEPSYSAWEADVLPLNYARE